MVFARLMGLKTVSPRELHQRLRTESITTIDVNSRQSWITSRIPGAWHLDSGYGEGDLPADKGAVLVFYCSNHLCRKAPTAARRATAMGYTNVLVMSAGISGWMQAKLPTESGDDEPRARQRVPAG